MDIIRDRGSISRLDVVDSGRRRRFSDEAKLAIVAESYRGPKQVSATARRRNGEVREMRNALSRRRPPRRASSTAQRFIVKNCTA